MKDEDGDVIFDPFTHSKYNFVNNPKQFSYTHGFEDNAFSLC